MLAADIPQKSDTVAAAANRPTNGRWSRAAAFQSRRCVPEALAALWGAGSHGGL